MQTTARVAAQSGSKYIRQLSKHWSHKFPLETGGDEEIIRFPDATVSLSSDETAILITIECDDADRLQELKPVVESHIDRFAFREGPLHYDWK